MARASIPVDLFNPGQVFACLGFVEATEVLMGGARGGFDWQNGENPSAVRFWLAANGDDDPIGRVLRFLDDARVMSLAPKGSSNSTKEKSKVETITDESGAFPFSAPSSPAILPACLEDGAGRSIVIDHWGDETVRDNMKFWAGSLVGTSLTRDALRLIQERRAVDQVNDPFSLSAEQSSSFRFDWRRDYISIDAGFSPNNHSDVKMRGYPIVELLAAVGLTNARPCQFEKLEYSYGVAGLVDDELYDPIFLRSALGGRRSPVLGMPFRLFMMRLARPDGKARCITNVIEENPPS